MTPLRRFSDSQDYGIVIQINLEGIQVDPSRKGG